MSRNRKRIKSKSNETTITGISTQNISEDIDVKKNIAIPVIFLEKLFFTSQQFAEVRKISQRTARRFLHSLVKEKSIEVFQRGPKTVYKKVA